MRKLNILNIALMIVVLVLCALSYQQTLAEQTQNFYRVMPFTTSGGYLGFFNNQDGMIYLYDDNLKECVYISQLTALGEPMKLLKSPRLDRKMGQ